MTKPKLHLDADTSRKAMLEALSARGHDVTRIPQADLAEEWVGQVRWLSDWKHMLKD